MGVASTPFDDMLQKMAQEDEGYSFISLNYTVSANMLNQNINQCFYSAWFTRNTGNQCASGAPCDIIVTLSKRKSSAGDGQNFHLSPKKGNWNLHHNI